MRDADTGPTLVACPVCDVVGLPERIAIHACVAAGAALPPRRGASTGSRSRHAVPPADLETDDEASSDVDAAATTPGDASHE